MSSSAPDEEYGASQPSLYFFLLKALIGALSLVVLAAAWVLRPRECFGICYVDPVHHALRCPSYDPAVLFYHRTAHSDDDNAVHALLRGQESKGFNHVSVDPFPAVAAALLPVDEDVAITYHNALCGVLGKGTPLMMRTKSNRTFFEGFTFAIDFEACLGQGSAAVSTLGLVRRPRDLLAHVYAQQRNASLPFAECVRNSTCIKTHDLDRWCAVQTRSFCGFAEECSTAQGLERAKRNVDSAVLVGLAEDPVAFASLARRILPTYFEFVSVWPAAASALSLPRASQVAIDELCAVDNALYLHAAQQFADRAHRCGVHVKWDGKDARRWWWPF